MVTENQREKWQKSEGERERGRDGDRKNKAMAKFIGAERGRDGDRKRREKATGGERGRDGDRKTEGWRKSEGERRWRQKKGERRKSESEKGEKNGIAV